LRIFGVSIRLPEGGDEMTPISIRAETTRATYSCVSGQARGSTSKNAYPARYMTPTRRFALLRPCAASPERNGLGNGEPRRAGQTRRQHVRVPFAEKPLVMKRIRHIRPPSILMTNGVIHSRAFSLLWQQPEGRFANDRPGPGRPAARFETPLADSPESQSSNAHTRNARTGGGVI